MKSENPPPAQHTCSQEIRAAAVKRTTSCTANGDSNRGTLDYRLGAGALARVAGSGTSQSSQTDSGPWRGPESPQWHVSNRLGAMAWARVTAVARLKRAEGVKCRMRSLAAGDRLWQARGMTHTSASLRNSSNSSMSCPYRGARRR